MEGHPLIAIHKGRYYKRSDGLALGPGPFVSALEYAADIKADVVGKPEPAFFQQALSDISCDLESAVMIGDVCFWLLLSTAYYFLRFNANIFRNTISCSCFSGLICVLEME